MTREIGVKERWLREQRERKVAANKPNPQQLREKVAKIKVVRKSKRKQGARK